MGGMKKIEGYKVISASEMRRIEKLSIEKGASDEAYMLKAAEGIAGRAEAFILESELEKSVTLLVGKGNNGGDAFAAGTFLLNRGFQVEAYHTVASGEASPLCQRFERDYIEAGGELHRGRDLPLKGLIIDGLLGTGFKGKLEGKILDVVQKANNSKLPILAIDIPSGVDGDSGEIDPVAIEARETLFLGLPKVGFFLNGGYNSIGKLCAIDFGMELHFIHEAQPLAYLIDEKRIGELLPPLKRTRHKYEAGYVIALAGSPGMAGAAMLASLAALRTGAGIVRLFYPEGMEGELASSPYELIRTSYKWGDPSKIFEEGKRASAALIGPGVGREKEMRTFVQQVVGGLEMPCVIDADGLLLLKEFPEGAILTPHYREMCTLLSVDSLTQELCQKFVDKNRVTLVLKGAPTWIYHPDILPLIIPAGDPGMATAGTGDVLTGMIAALVAQKLRGREAAALGVYLHALAGEIAAEKMTSYDMIASDLIEALPSAFQRVLARTTR
ncbi:MAG: Bifunctional NAD(P)H-hydrate repair enzyme Nnr [Chlamydiae bacterium]|nr:Bifunctional NAD(P)H-hydrate repair enzyme Nnr [Chlamydiota bacterium]